MNTQNTEFDFEDIDLAGLNIDGLEVVNLKEAMALPETGASSGISSCNSCSSCGSSSCTSMK
jgi:thiazolylpeptide-type bacteriocin precursor